MLTSGVFAPGVAPASGTDVQGSYLSWWFRLIGVHQIGTLRHQPAMTAHDPVHAFETALKRARTLA